MTLGSLSVVAVAIAFSLLVYAVYRPGARDRIERYGRIPVDDFEQAFTRKAEDLE